MMEKEDDNELRAEVDTIAERLSMLKAQVAYNEIVVKKMDVSVTDNIGGIKTIVSEHVDECRGFVEEQKEWRMVLGAEMKFMRCLMAKMKSEVLGNGAVPQDDWERLDRLCACLQVGTNEVARILDVEEEPL